jgi:hypothetical protein
MEWTRTMMVAGFEIMMFGRRVKEQQYMVTEVQKILLAVSWRCLVENIEADSYCM